MRMTFDLARIIAAHSNHAHIALEGTNERGMVHFQCLLCKTSMMNDGEVHAHCRQADHIASVEALRKLQQSPFNFVCAALRPRIQALGLLTWQTEIEAAMYRMSLQQFMTHGVKEKIDDINALVTKYERMERVSLLELAVWKAMSMSTFQRKQANHGYQEWWESAKSETRSSNEITVVIVAVVPFLG
jgi:hypothetical protein